MFQRCLIAGLGLMGSSLALALRNRGLGKQFYGIDNNAEHCKKALHLKAVDKIISADTALPAVDFLALCTPYEAFGSILKLLPKDMPANCLIIDIASVKAPAIKIILANLPDALQRRYMPCHPIAGAASYGPDAASGDMFKEQNIILTPHEITSDGALDLARHLWRKVGGLTRTLTAEKHDRVYAYVSHLPQLLAYAFLLAYHGQFTAKGTERFLRIGASNPQLWEGIFMSNRDALLMAIEEFQIEMRCFPQFSAYGQLQSALGAITIDEYKSYVGPGYRDFTCKLPIAVEEALPQNPLPFHHEIANFHNALQARDSERLLKLMRKAKAIHSQCFF